MMKIVVQTLLSTINGDRLVMKSIERDFYGLVEVRMCLISLYGL